MGHLNGPCEAVLRSIPLRRSPRAKALGTVPARSLQRPSVGRVSPHFFACLGQDSLEKTSEKAKPYRSLFALPLGVGSGQLQLNYERPLMY